MIKDFIDDTKIENILAKAKNPPSERVREIIAKAKELKGLTPEEVAMLLQTEDDELISLILQTAHKIKEDIYGNRLVLFAPLYIANLCSNNCLYCGFQARQQGTQPRRSDDGSNRKRSTGSGTGRP